MIIHTLIGGADEGGGSPPLTGFRFDPNYVPIVGVPAIYLFNSNTSAADAIPGVYSVLTTENLAAGGKYTWTFVLTSYTDPLSLIGIGNLDTNLYDFLGVNTDSFGVRNDGVAFCAGSQLQTGLPTFTSAGSVIDIAVNLTISNFWYRVNDGDWNGSPTADPATNTGGIFINPPVTGTVRPALTIGGTNDFSTFAIAGSNIYSVPVGYTFLGY